MAVKKKAAKKTIKSPVKKKLATQKAAPRPKSIARVQTKAEIIADIAEETGLTKKEVSNVFGTLGTLIQRHMQRRGSGELSIPDAGVKIKRIRKPATKARMGHNPATGEAMKIPPKPARNAIKLLALKALQETLS